VTAGPTLDPGTRDWLADAFALAHVSQAVPFGRGTTTRVWRVETSRGMFAGQEVHGQAPTDDDLGRELALVEACCGVGIPVPAAVPTAGGAISATHPETGCAWRLHEWVDGEAPQPGDVPTDLWLAGQLARIHALAVPPEADERVDARHATVDVDWCRLAEDALAEGACWAVSLARRRPELVELSALVDAAPAGSPVRTHRNATAANTLLGRDGGRWLLGWDDIGPLVPERELGVLLLDHIGSEPVLRGIATAYRGAGGTGLVGDPSTFATGLAIRLGRLGAGVASALESAPSGQGHAAQDVVVADLVLRMPTPAMVQRALRQLRR